MFFYTQYRRIKRSLMIQREHLKTLLNLAEFRTTDTALHEAAYNGDLPALKTALNDEELLKCIDNRNLLGCTALRLAASCGNESCVKELLCYNASVDISDLKAQTALHSAVKAKSCDCVRLLLQSGANPNGDSQNICTPIYHAAFDGSHEIIKELVDYGADIDSEFARSAFGNWSSAPLYVTVVYRRWKSFYNLLILGADPNIHCKHYKDEHGDIKSTESLYHGAVAHDCDIKFAQLLYECGASLLYRNPKGKLAWELDFDNDIKKYLMKLSANPMKLKSICRISIRQSLGRYRLKYVDELPLPAGVIDFLNFKYDNIL